MLLTLGDIRAGRSNAGKPCAESAPLWDALWLPDDTTIDVLLERWTPLAAVWLAQADGHGPVVGAVSWVEWALGTNVLFGADLRGLDLCGADFAHADLGDTNFHGADLRWASFDGAYLAGAVLAGANLEGAIFVNAYRPGGGVPGWEPDGDGYLKRTGHVAPRRRIR